MVSLAELRARNVQPVWQEAVAVVQELIQSTTTSGGTLPDLEHVALIPNGDVVAMPGSPEAADPVRQAATMLRVLIDGTATPPELEEFVRKNLSSASAPDLVEFARGLSFYERPGRRADVERLVARAGAAEQLTRADEELRRLKERATEAIDHRLDDTVFMDTVAMSGRRRQPVAAIAGVALLVVAAGGAWWWWRDRARAPQAPASASAAATTNPAAASTSAAGAAMVDKTADKSAATSPSAGGASAVQSPATTDKSAAAPASAGGASALQPPAAPTANSATSGGRASALQPANGAQGAAAAGVTASNATHGVTPTPGAASGAAPNAPLAPSAPTAPSSTAPSLFARAKAAVQSAVNSIVGPPASPEHAAASVPSASEPVAPKKAHHKKPLPVPPPAPGRGPVAVAVDVPAPVPTPAAGPETAALPVVADATIYSPADTAVIKPVLVRPVLPKEPPPGVPLNQIGSIEVLVDEQGDVEQVKLFSPANRFHERMMVSAAKMWKFRPAFKDGHPVRYREKIRITL